jgi:hypothetical protein
MLALLLAPVLLGGVEYSPSACLPVATVTAQPDLFPARDDDREVSASAPTAFPACAHPCSRPPPSSLRGAIALTVRSTHALGPSFCRPCSSSPPPRCERQGSRGALCLTRLKSPSLHALSLLLLLLSWLAMPLIALVMEGDGARAISASSSQAPPTRRSASGKQHQSRTASGKQQRHRVWPPWPPALKLPPSRHPSSSSSTRRSSSTSRRARSGSSPLPSRGRSRGTASQPSASKPPSARPPSRPPSRAPARSTSRPQSTPRHSVFWRPQRPQHEQHRHSARTRCHFASAVSLPHPLPPRPALQEPLRPAARE